MEFTTIIKVRGFHEDRFGHVNNARYLEFLEEGRWDYLDARGPQGGFPALGVFPVVAHLAISYRRPTSAGDTVHVSTRVAEVSSRKIVMHQTIHQEEAKKLCCEADVTLVLVDAATGRPAVLNADIVSAWPDLAQAGSGPSGHPPSTLLEGEAHGQ
ncbi:MAG: acyl-CoA thioesterase [Candidatus Atribacteria bacterium]|jgi:thioesterase-3|nr:MAG: acyl-CoA thioesterase [Candidatus Atribacteria bacterium]